MRLVADLQNGGRSIRFLIRHRDAKFTASFDEVFASEEIRVIKTPRALASGERLRGEMGEDRESECLDHLLILGEPHLEAVLRDYLATTTISVRTVRGCRRTSA